MKSFIFVVLVCYLCAISASVLPKVNKLVKNAAECRSHSYLELGKCAKLAFENGTAELQCISNTVVDYIDCIGSLPAPPPTTTESPLSFETWPPSEESQAKSRARMKCLFNNTVDTVKCLVNGQMTGGSDGVNWPVVMKCLIVGGPALFRCPS